MDSWKIFLLICQLSYLLFLSLVDFVKSFLEHLGIITCDDNYVCYIALIALKTRDSCLWYLDRLFQAYDRKQRFIQDSF